jgi:hypothetical protein
VDATTRELLRQAREDDLYMSDVSPLGIPFNNVRKTGSEIWTQKRVAKGRPGSPCPKQILVSNTEFTQKPICLASREYQKTKLKEIDKLDISADEKSRRYKKVMEKTCICDHLGNGALIDLGIAQEKNSPQSICPGPNIEWFDKFYTLEEMVDHIYGRGSSLVSSKRPHMFAKEIVMYVNYFERMVADSSLTPSTIKALLEFKNNLEAGLDFCLEIANKPPNPDENLASISDVVERERVRLKSICNGFEKKIN